VSLSLGCCIIDIDIDIYVNIDSTPVPARLQQTINAFIERLAIERLAIERLAIERLAIKIPADTANETICAWLSAAAAGDHDATQNLEALHARYLKVRDADVILIMLCIQQ
jgi:hypothetical protein